MSEKGNAAMSNPHVPRRTFIGGMTAIVMAIIGLLLLIPGVGYVLGPLGRKRDTR
jgi:hypothetical protein